MSIFGGGIFGGIDDFLGGGSGGASGKFGGLLGQGLLGGIGGWLNGNQSGGLTSYYDIVGEDGPWGDFARLRDDWARYATKEDRKAQGRAKKIHRKAGRQLDKMGQRYRRDIDRGWKEADAQSGMSLASRGLANSTVLDQQYRGNRQVRNDSLLNLEDQMADNYYRHIMQTPNFYNNAPFYRLHARSPIELPVTQSGGLFDKIF